MDSSRKVAEIIDIAEAEIRKEYARSIGWLRRRRTIEVLTRLIAERKYQDLLDADGIERVATVLSAAKSKAHRAAGKSVADYIAGRLEEPVNYDRANALAVARAEQNRYAMVQQITAEQKQLIYDVITDGVRNGVNPKEMARDFKGSIGLTQHQRKIVNNYRASLEAGSTDALNRELRDRRFDSIVETAIEEDKKLPAAKIDQLVNAYERKFIAHRAETIARDAALQAAHQGARDNWASAVQQGRITAEQVERTWRHGPRRKHSRASHIAMNGQKRSLGEAFKTSDGVSIAYPGDPSAPPSETIRCTCVVVTRLVR